MKDIPVYLFLGFLESGKTKFIQETLCDERFNNGEKTLLLVCEEGIEEYEPAEFSGQNVTVEYIDEEAALTEKSLAAMAKKAEITRGESAILSRTAAVTENPGARIEPG